MDVSSTHGRGLFCQVLFYHVSTFIWKKNDLPPEEVHERQDSLLNSVFNIKDLEGFKASLRDPIKVKTWRGQTVYLPKKMMNELVGETCLLGPVAAMYGREFQQFLLTNKGETKIAVDEMEYSVNCGRASLSKKKVEELLNLDMQKYTQKDRSSPASTRTRTPPRFQNKHGGEPWKDTVRYSHPGYPREGQERNTYDDRFRYTDIRERPDYDRLRQQQDHLRQQERIRDYQDRSRRTSYQGYYRRDDSEEEERPRRYERDPSYDRSTGTREPRHYDRDEKRELRGYHKDEWYHKEDSNHSKWWD